MATNKVVYGNQTLIDLTADTATEADVRSGKTFHKANGSSATGTASMAKEEQSKSITATTSQQTVTPDSGKVLSSVVVNPQSHSETYTPAANTASNDMGANHNKRYVNTSGMIVPSGTQSIAANGTYDISSKASVNVSVAPQKISTYLYGYKPNTTGQTAAVQARLNLAPFYSIGYRKIKVTSTGGNWASTNMYNSAGTATALTTGTEYSIPSDVTYIRANSNAGSAARSVQINFDIY